MIKILKGVSGYRSNGSGYRYGSGSIVSEWPEIERDLVKAGLAEYADTPKTFRPIAEPPDNFAVTPVMRKEKVIKAVVKRGRHV